MICQNQTKTMKNNFYFSGNDGYIADKQRCGFTEGRGTLNDVRNCTASTYTSLLSTISEPVRGLSVVRTTLLERKHKQNVEATVLLDVDIPILKHLALEIGNVWQDSLVRYLKS